ncbi:MAG: YihY/virulence factor BrkB family protein [Acidimicrobiia bacterium]
MARDKKPPEKQRQGLVENVVVPVASGVVLAAAAVRSAFDRRSSVEPSGPSGPAGAPSGNGSAPAPRQAGEDGKKKPRWLQFVLAVHRRYGEVRGNHVAASFTLQAFLAIFPLLLVGIAVLGFVSAGSERDIGAEIVNEVGLSGDAAETLTQAIEKAESSRQAASVIGLVGLLWSGLGLVGALQHAYNTVWQVNERGLKDKAFGLAWLAGAGVLFIAGAAATTALRWLPGVLAPLGILVTFGVSFGLWLWTSRVLPNREVPWRALVPGAVVGAVGLEILKFVGAYYVPRAVASSSELYGSLGVVFAVLAWLLFFGRLVMYSAVVNVVLYERASGTMRVMVEAPLVPGFSGSDAEANRSGRLVHTEP